MPIGRLWFRSVRMARHRTAQYIHTILKMGMKKAVETRKIERNPLEFVQRPKAQKKQEGRSLESHEIRVFLSAAKSLSYSKQASIRRSFRSVSVIPTLCSHSPPTHTFCRLCKRCRERHDGVFQERTPRPQFQPAHNQHTKTKIGPLDFRADSRKTLIYRASFWSQRQESNLRPTDYKSVALPSELRWREIATDIKLTHPHHHCQREKNCSRYIRQQPLTMPDTTVPLLSGKYLRTPRRLDAVNPCGSLSIALQAFSPNACALPQPSIGTVPSRMAMPLSPSCARHDPPVQGYCCGTSMSKRTFRLGVNVETACL